jgi:hypothetical protein
MWINPIYDRTLDDVTHMNGTKRRIDSGGFDALTEAEKTAYLNHLKGAVDFFAFNRWEGNLAYLKDLLDTIGTNINFESKEWDATKDFMDADFRRIINAANHIRTKLDLVGAVNPQTHYIQINLLEQTMAEVIPIVETIVSGYRYAGDIYAGDWS